MRDNLVEPSNQMIVEYAVLSQIKSFTKQYLAQNPKMKIPHYFLMHVEKIMGFYSLKENDDLKRLSSLPLNEDVQNFLENEFWKVENFLRFTGLTRLLMLILSMIFIFMSGFSLSMMLSILVAYAGLSILLSYGLHRIQADMLDVLIRIFTESPETYGKRLS